MFLPIWNPASNQQIIVCTLQTTGEVGTDFILHRKQGTFYEWDFMSCLPFPISEQCGYSGWYQFSVFGDGMCFISRDWVLPCNPLCVVSWLAIYLMGFEEFQECTALCQSLTAFSLSLMLNKIKSNLTTSGSFLWAVIQHICSSFFKKWTGWSWTYHVCSNIAHPQRISLWPQWPEVFKSEQNPLFSFLSF